MERESRLALVIDDDPLERMSFGAFIEDQGWRVLVAANGAEAAAEITGRAMCPSLILCDRQVAGESGLAALLRLRSLCGPRVLYVLLTGDTLPELVDRRAHKGVRAVYKPVMPEDICRLLREAGRA